MTDNTKRQHLSTSAEVSYQEVGDMDYKVRRYAVQWDVGVMSFQAGEWVLYSDYARLADELERLKRGHCRDCCCARSWEALGISEYTGNSIPEEIHHLIKGMAVAQDLAADLREAQLFPWR